MSAFIPSGYISVHEALDLVGGELSSEWTGEEHRARAGLIGEKEWSKIKDVIPARGADAPGGGLRMQVPQARLPVAAMPHWTGDPSDPSYQGEYRARERYATALHKLRVGLEAGHFEASVLDRFTGILHPAPRSLWRRPIADRLIEKGEAPIPYNPNTGRLFVKRFADASVHAKSMPEAIMREAIKALKEKTATEYLTRPQQKEFLRKKYRRYRVSTRLMDKIVQSVHVRAGRPRKSDKKV